MRLAPFQSTVISHLIGAALSPGQLESLVLSPPSGSIEDRWHIYTSGYLARFVEAIENDYPATRRILGEGPFGSLVRRYVQARPSQSYDLGQIGRSLPRFLETDPLSEGLPFLRDLARFEWALAEAFVAADLPPLTWEAVTSLSPEAVAELPLTLHPSVRVVRSDWPLFDLHDSRDVPDQGLSIELRDRPLIALVHRESAQVVRRSLNSEEASLLEAVIPGITLTQLSARPEVAASRLSVLFRNWVAEQLLAAAAHQTP